MYLFDLFERQVEDHRGIELLESDLGQTTGEPTQSTNPTCFLTLEISACSLWMLRLSSEISILLFFKSSPCFPAVICSSWY